MLRIRTVTFAPKRAELRAEGQIVAQWVGAVEREVSELVDQGRAVHLDLSSVTFIGPSGIRMLRRLLALPAVTVHCTPLIQALLGLG